MDHTKFDALTRALGAGRSRRSVVKGLGKGLGAAAVGAVGLSRLGSVEAAKGGGGVADNCNVFCQDGPGRGASHAACVQACHQCGGIANTLYNCNTSQLECVSETCQPSSCCSGTCLGTCCTC